MRDWKEEIRERLSDLNLDPVREQEIVEELSQHLEDCYNEFLASAASEREASIEALEELSDSNLLSQKLRQTERSIGQEVVIAGGGRRINMFADIWQDVRYGIRTLSKNVGFTVIAVLTLAIGIGANSAIFSIVNSMLLRPLPVENPDRLVSLNNSTENRTFATFSYPNYKDFRDRNDVFSSLIAYRFAPLNTSYDGVNERLWGYVVTGNYFGALGVRAAAGRMISEEDDVTPGGHPVAVLSYKYWRQRFGGDQNAIGQNLIANGRSYTIIGVAPESFFGTEVIAAPQIWFPISMQKEIEVGSDWLNNREAEGFFVQGYLKPGVSLPQAQTAINSIAAQLESEYPEINEGKRVTLANPGFMGGSMRGALTGFAGLLMAVVGLVLLLACANLANLLLARASERRREIAVRLALGASRFRLVRQLLTESLLLAFSGGILGLLIVFWLTSLVASFKIPLDLPISFDLHVDRGVLVFTFLLSLITGVLFGLLPALQATKTDVAQALKDGSSLIAHQRTRLKNGLIVFQVALSLTLLVGGGLMLRALQQAQTVDLGFDPQNAVEISFDLRLQGYEKERGKEFQKTLLERVRALPRVEQAGITDLVPVDLHFSRSPVFVEGQLPEREATAPRALTSRISPGYFQAMNTRLVRGRDFTERDDENATRVVIVNEVFARYFWPEEDAIGKRFSLSSEQSPKMEIIGVAQDGKYSGLNEDPKPFVYRPLLQSYSGTTSIVVRSQDDPQRIIAAVRREAQQLDSYLPISSRTLVERMSVPLLAPRIAASVLGSFGLLALALAAIGLYGVMAYTVSKRTREIGIRMSLGAEKRDILNLIIRQGMLPAIIGMVIGMLGAIALTRLMKSFLFGVSAIDPLTYIGVTMLLAVVALAACYIPARRATKVDPMVALRYE